ncbi:hypothetical protein WJX84_011342 [Apatococcus fuscideae]|uniref:RING-type domain-containing protein n=1 Tax=Apatococcus fuscideae TaxID=2026836 RepID=A0AAW1SEY4_9CHLO
MLVASSCEISSGSKALAVRLISAQPLWTSDTFPNPLQEPERCKTQGRESTACDPDGILSKRGFQFLDNVLKDIIVGDKPYSKSSCSTSSQAPGYKVAVAVMQHMKLSHGGDAASTARRFAKDLHNKWGVGDGSCSDGILLLLSIDDRQVYISTGKAARTRLTDGYAATIISSMKPALRRGEYDGAIQQAVVDIGLVLAGSVPQQPDDNDSGNGWLGGAIFVAFFGFLLTGCWRSGRTRGQSRRCRSLLDKLKKDQAQAMQQHRFPATTCPICLEDIQSPTRNPESGGPSSSSAAGNDAAPSGSGSSGAGPSAAQDTAADRSSPSAPLLGGGDKSKEEGESASPKKRALTLPCGHAFCEDCIDRWVQDKNTCPICRKPLDETAPPPSKMGEQQLQRQQQRQRQQTFGQDMLAAEMAFRLTNLQRMYPNHINRNMLDTWTDQARHGAVIDWDSQRALALDTAAHHTNYSSGTGMASFGGGSSFGGGGSGGSW